VPDNRPSANFNQFLFGERAAAHAAALASTENYNGNVLQPLRSFENVARFAKIAAQIFIHQS
jgi:hypothetical protein